MTRGWFIAFEGGEGSGKSTQARRLADALDAVLTREPGDTVIGAQLRQLLLDPATEATPITEALLMAADRAEHVARVVHPALAAGRYVVCDRDTGSSVAYQGYGRGLDVEQIIATSMWATGDLEPDIVVLLEVPAEVATTRLGDGLDRFESTGDGFHDRVRAGFEAQAEADPDRWVRVDGDRPPDQVAADILSLVRDKLSR
jgi:dTMP kinase